MKKKLWAIYHLLTVDGGYGDAIPQDEMVGIVEATDEEIKAFVEKYDRPVVYDEPYDKLTCHGIQAQEIKVIHNLDEVEPYGPDDYYGQKAEEYEFEKKFEEIHGRYFDWRYSDNSEELSEQYRKGHEEIRAKWEAKRGNGNSL